MKRGPGVMTAACLIAAPMLALFLLIVPFAGAREHVVDGVTLMALGSGWAAIAILTTRYSTQPQRWALAPGGLLVGAGVVSLAWAGSVESRVAGWAWPAILLGLVAFIWRRSDRQPLGRARRWVLHPVLLAMTLAGVAGAYESVAEARDAREHPFPGRMIEVQGRLLHLDCRGDGAPTVVLVSGFGGMSSHWTWIAEDVGRDARVCAFDPAGRAWSEPVDAPQDGIARTRDLHDLLRAAGEAGPFVLVGHSFGGLYARIFAAQYPEAVAGMVLLDATPAEMFSLSSYPTIYEVYRRAAALFPLLSRFGFGRVLYASAGAGLPRHAREEVRALSVPPRALREQRDEWAEAPIAMAQARALVTLGDRPLMVVTAARGAQEGWLPLQRQLTELSANVEQRLLPQADHGGLLEDEGQAMQSARAIRDVVTAVRTVPGSHLLGQPLRSIRRDAAFRSSIRR